MDAPTSKPPTLAYAQGGFEKPPRTWTLLGTFNVLVGAMMVWFNLSILSHTWAKLYGPPAPPPHPSSDVMHVTVARWQHWVVLTDAAVSVALVGLLLAGVVAIALRKTGRTAIRLNEVYVWLKAGLALVVASLYGWDVDKSRLDWGLFAMTLLMGAIHPLIVLAMIAKLRTGLRGETR